jgi:transposase
LLKQEGSKKEIFLKVKPNPRNKWGDSEPYSNGSFIFDALLYPSRTVIERANAWIDDFKALLVRFERRARNWEALHYIAFLVIFSRKIKNKNKV